MGNHRPAPGRYDPVQRDTTLLVQRARRFIKEDGIDRLLNSDWAFGFTQTGGRRRQLLIILGAAWLWASAAYLTNPWDHPLTVTFVAYPFRALFFLPLFFVIFLMAGLVYIGLRLSVHYLIRERFSRRRLRLASISLAALVGFIWAWLASSFTPLGLPNDFVSGLLSYPFDALFVSEVFRHVVAAGLGFWLAYQGAAFYLDDVFELQEPALAERFILQTAFGSQYNLINIQDGDVAPEARGTTVIRVGGPGIVRVHLENAALFEPVDGSPRVVPASNADPNFRNDLVVLKGFERLRSVIDLRDKMEKFSVAGRTRDGIRVQANDVRFVFSISRDGLSPSSNLPYPFDPEAVEKLVYDQGSGNWTDVMKSMVRGELLKFISEHSLSEFLASISEPEYEQSRQREEELIRQFGQDTEETPAARAGALPATHFVARSEISELFTTDFAQRAAKAGFELKWIGLGTWDLPAEIIPEQHLEAWKLSRENLIRGSQIELDRVRRDNFRAEFIRLVQEVPIAIFNRSLAGGKTPAEIIRAVVRSYRETLRRAYEVHLAEEDTAGAERVGQVLGFLSRFTLRWLGSRES